MLPPPYQDIWDPHLTAHHVPMKNPYILQEVDADVGVAEEVGEEQLIRNTVGARCRAPIRRGRNKMHGIQPALVQGYYRSHTFGRHCR